MARISAIALRHHSHSPVSLNSYGFTTSGNWSWSMEKPRRTRRYCRRSFHKCHRYKTSTGIMGSLPKTQFGCRTSTLLSRDSTYPVTSARRTVRFHPIFSTIRSTSHSLHGHLLRAVTTLLTWLTNVYQASPLLRLPPRLLPPNHLPRPSRRASIKQSRGYGISCHCPQSHKPRSRCLQPPPSSRTSPRWSDVWLLR